MKVIIDRLQKIGKMLKRLADDPFIQDYQGGPGPGDDEQEVLNHLLAAGEYMRAVELPMDPLFDEANGLLTGMLSSIIDNAQQRLDATTKGGEVDLAAQDQAIAAIADNVHTLIDKLYDLTDDSEAVDVILAATEQLARASEELDKAQVKPWSPEAE
jgi:outer membrane murein-binding lipoprotein Lpp